MGFRSKSRLRVGLNARATAQTRRSLLAHDGRLTKFLETLRDGRSEGGFFTANMSFPTDYPNKPPSVKFVSDMWHPNVYADGRVCISILHSPGDDPMGYEQASERWSPVQTVETIMLSIISMLSSPNDESPANIDAAKQFRDDPAGFRKRVAQCVRRSQEM